MPRVDVNPTALAPTGVFPAGTVGNVDGNAIRNTGKEFVELVNANATTARVVTFPTPVTPGGLALADQSISVAAASRTLVGPFSPNLFNQTDGKVYINYVSGAEAADVTVRAYRFPE